MRLNPRAAWITGMRDSIIPADAARLLLIPEGPAGKRLHPTWRGIACVFCQLPAILARGGARADQALVADERVSIGR